MLECSSTMAYYFEEIKNKKSKNIELGSITTSMHYCAQSWRLKTWDFKVASETTKRVGKARIPQGSTVEDWPLGLEELEPFYDKV